MQDLRAFSEQILHLRATYAKLNGLWRSGQPLHLCEMSGQLSAERSFDIWKNDMIENMKYLQHWCKMKEFLTHFAFNKTSWWKPNRFCSPKLQFCFIFEQFHLVYYQIFWPSPSRLLENIFARLCLTKKKGFNYWLQEEDKSSFLDDIHVGTKNDTTFVLVEGNIGGAVVLSKSFIFDGKEWTELASMSVPRANPSCTLVDMDDGEVTFYSLQFSLSSCYDCRV
jgi:hypothetical protein